MICTLFCNCITYIRCYFLFRTIAHFSVSMKVNEKQSKYYEFSVIIYCNKQTTRHMFQNRKIMPITLLIFTRNFFSFSLYFSRWCTVRCSDNITPLSLVKCIILFNLKGLQIIIDSVLPSFLGLFIESVPAT